MIDPGWAAVIAAFVSLVLGVTGIRNSSSAAKRALVREGQQHRAEAYVQVLRIVEIRGLAVQDDMYNYTETGDNAYDAYAPTLPKREIAMPDKTDRAEARALLAAYGSDQVRQAFEAWLAQIDAWDRKTSGWSLEFDLNGPPELTKEDAEPERADEAAARAAVGDAVSRELT